MERWNLGIAGLTCAVSLVTMGLASYLVHQEKIGSQNQNQSQEQKEVVRCRVTIVGAGIGGLYTAYKLSEQPEYKNEICLVEKEADHYGGRIFDVKPITGATVFGTGALRITKQHPNMMVLAQKFGIHLQAVNEDDELVKVRGVTYLRIPSNTTASGINTMCHERYINLTCGNKTLDADYYYIAQLIEAYKKIQGNATELIKYSDMHTFALATLGDEATRLLSESNRINIFIEMSSIESFVDFIEDEPTGQSDISYRRYPIGGMSVFVDNLLQRATSNGVRLFRDERITSIYNKDFDSDSPYVAASSTRQFVAAKLVIAVPAKQLSQISGNIVETISRSNEFKMIVPVKVATVAAWFSHKWWKDLPWSFARVVTRQVCFNVMELPDTPYISSENVIRVVYDEWNCVDSWETLINGPNETLIAEVMRGLHMVFPQVSIPQPTMVRGQVWEDGWHFNRGSNEQVENWASQPLDEQHIALVGSAYNLKWNVWTEGAIVSSMRALVKHFKFNFDKCPCNLNATSECFFDGICTRSAQVGRRNYRCDW